MKKVICIGSSCKDIFLPTNEGIVTNTPDDLKSQVKIAFELGAKYPIEERFESTGGCAANVACGLGRLGIDVGCYSKIGNDDVGKWIKEELQKNNVDVSLVEEELGFASDLSAIIIDEKSGDRIIFSNQKVNTTLKIDERKIKSFAWIFIGDLHGEWENDLDKICEIAQKNSIKIAYNPRQVNIHKNPQKILEILPQVEIVFLNKDEAIELVDVFCRDDEKTNLNNEEFLLKKIKELGTKNIIITDGGRGAWGFLQGGILHVNAILANPIDSTGAGDAFASGFLASYIKGNNSRECLHWGIVNGGSVVNFYGGVEGLLKEEEILNKILE